MSDRLIRGYYICVIRTTVPPSCRRIVAIKRPGSTTFVAWQRGQTGTSATFLPDAGVGQYSFKSRLRNPVTKAREMARWIVVPSDGRTPGGASAAASFTRSAISQHLGVLKAAGLVSERRDGTRRLYLARQDEMHKLREFLDDYWTTGLERLRDVAEAAQRNKGATDGRAHP